MVVEDGIRKAVAALGWFKFWHHDRPGFEVFCYNYGFKQTRETRVRVAITGLGALGLTRSLLAIVR